MKEYNFEVPIEETHTGTAYYSVEASSLEEAKSKVKETFPEDIKISHHTFKHTGELKHV